MSNFHVTILTIFPNMFPGPLSYSLAGKGLRNKLWTMDIIDIHDFGLTKHKNVDDIPYGGGNGLVMRPDVLGSALDKVLDKYPSAKILYPSPRGKLLNQQLSLNLSEERSIIIICGRFKGIDERIISEYNATQISVGYSVLSGGETAAMVILDSVVRTLPGIITNQQTLKEGSFQSEMGELPLFEYPLYTKPEIWKGKQVPKILLSGDHSKVKKWKKSESVRVTKEKLLP